MKIGIIRTTGYCPDTALTGPAPITDCILTMNSGRSAGAGFDFCPARIGGACYSSLTAAVGAAVNGDMLRSMEYTFTENLNLDRGIAVTLAGGYDSEYGNNANDAATTLRGIVSVKSGSLTVDKLIIQ